MASIFFKDKSWVNKIIFPAPKPSSYDADSFDCLRYGCLCWIPRENPSVRRKSSAKHDPESVPCLYFPCRPPGSNKIVLFCHGNAEDLGNSPGKLAKIRDCLGVHVIGIEYPGYGISRGTPSETALTQDVHAVFAFLTGVVKWPADDIILFGYSIGTGPTTALAATVEDQVGALVLLAPYTSIRDMVGEVLPKAVGKVAGYLIANRFVNSQQIAKVTCPVLIIHGKKDSLIPCSHGQTLYNSCRHERKLLYLVDEMDHNYTDDDFECFVLFPMMDFLDLGADKKHVVAPRDLVLPNYIFVKPPAEETKLIQDARREWEKKHNLHIGSSDEEDSVVNPARNNTAPVNRKPFNTAPAATDLNGPNGPPKMRCKPVQRGGGYNPNNLHRLPKKPAGNQNQNQLIVPWACSVCTFQNMASRSVCEICLHHRGADSLESLEPVSTFPGLNQAKGVLAPHQLPALVVEEKNDESGSDEERAIRANFVDDSPSKPIDVRAEVKDNAQHFRYESASDSDKEEVEPKRTQNECLNAQEKNSAGLPGQVEVTQDHSKGAKKMAGMLNMELPQMLVRDGDDAEELEWACPMCTYLNASSAPVCEICGIGSIAARNSTG